MIAEVIERLTAEASGLTSIAPAEALELIAKGTAPRNGACFVLPFQDRASPNMYLSGAFRQRVETQFLVAFVIRRQDDAKGGKRVGSFDAFRDAIEAALAGWCPEGSTDPCELVSARSASLGNGVTIYVQTWRTGRFLEDQP